MFSRYYEFDRCGRKRWAKLAPAGYLPEQIPRHCDDERGETNVFLDDFPRCGPDAIYFEPRK